MLCALLMLGCAGGKPVERKPPHIRLPGPGASREVRALAFMNARVSGISFGKVRIGELGYYEPEILAELCSDLGAWEASGILYSKQPRIRNYGSPDCPPGGNCGGPVSSSNSSEILAIVAIVVGIMLLALLIQQAEEHDREGPGIRGENLEPAAVAYNRFLIQKLDLQGYSPLIPSGN
jgi:hypothetical protein